MRYFLLIALFYSIFYNASAQNCPPNIDLEQGNFNNWDCSIGFTSSVNGQNIISLQPSLPTPGRHQIISADSTGKIPLDEYGNFPQLCPYGGKYSVKLGNNISGGEAEGISYTFTVPATEDTFSFTYFYAVVFENPSHSIDRQPRFFVTAYEVETGNVINCASYNYVSTGGLPGFMKSEKDPNILYKNWSPSSIQFVNLGNKQVRLEFKTADCTEGGHFGYAYLDVGSGCSNILATAPYCIETNSLLLNAPYGFQHYTWYNETFTKILGHEQNITLSPPPATAGKFYVDLVPYPGYGCRDTVFAEVHPLPVPLPPEAKTDYFYCQYANADALSAVASLNSDLLWYTDTMQPAITKAPVPSTAKPGLFTFYVSQKVLFGCESFKKKIMVRVDPVPDVSFSINNKTQCLSGNSFSFTSTSSNLQDSSFTWAFGDGNIDSGVTVAHLYKNFGSFPVILTVRNGPVCYKEFTENVLLIPKPVAGFSYPSLLCENETQLVLTDQSSVPQNLTAIASWHWKIMGEESVLQNPIPFLLTMPGEVPVSLFVVTGEGCVSDTNYQVLQVHDHPKAMFNYDGPLCSNKQIFFKDQSRFSSNAKDENISTWLWQFDNEIYTTQNPVYQYGTGLHRTILTVKSSAGCSSTPADSLLQTFPEPVIGVSINDSCVNRAIYFTTQDLANNVTDWYWNFGDRTKKAAAVETKSFSHAGDYSFILYGQTTHHCTDTLQRRFMVYDNKAFAGRDTLAAYNQPVQLNANGGSDNHYTWRPSFGLTNDTLQNPVATATTDIVYRLDAVNNEGCDSHSKITIKRWNGPDIYIPTAFTPNGDRLNEVLHAKPVGMKSLGYFAVYDRYNNLVFYTTDFTQGWNGKIKTADAQPGTFIAVAQATDYTGKSIMKKVAVVLIR